MAKRRAKKSRGSAAAARSKTEGDSSLRGDQLDSLRDLRRELTSNERMRRSGLLTDVAVPEHEESNDQSGSQRLPLIPWGQVRDTTLVDLWSRASSRDEGIEYQANSCWYPIPLGEADKTLFDLVVNRGLTPRQLAIGFARVPTGVCACLAVMAMAARALIRSTRQPAAYSEWILLASRERSLRDLYLSQRITFSGTVFSVASFPAFRLKLNGEAAPISHARPNRLSTPVLFYHFDPRVPTPRIPGGGIGLAIAELSESDSRLSEDLLDRLERLTGPDTQKLILFNSYDDRARQCLEARGFAVTHMRPPTDEPFLGFRLPSAASSFSGYAIRQHVRPVIVDDQGDVSDALYQASRELAKIGKSFETPEARALLSRWWGLWRTLKDLSVPLERFERQRVHGSGRLSLETAIARVVRSARGLNNKEAIAMEEAAATVATRLNKVYDSLLEGCPKAERLQQEVAALDDRRSTEIVLGDRIQVEVQRELTLLAGQDVAALRLGRWVTAATLARAAPVHTCILPGVWSPWQDSAILAVGAREVKVLAYPYEVGLLKRRLDEHLEESAHLHERLRTGSVLPPLLEIDEEELELLGSPPTQKWADSATHEPPSRSGDPETTAVDAVDDLGDAGPGLILTFTDGTSLGIRPQSEMLIVLDDRVESIFASALQIGDLIAVIDETAGRSLFESILERVNHLIRADPEVIDLWRLALKRIAYELPLDDGDIITRLRGYGCGRTAQTMRSWFRGTTMAPRDREDIERVLTLAGFQNADQISTIVLREVKIIRGFNRKLGRRIRAQIRSEVSGRAAASADRLDFEIDEAIESVEYREIASIQAQPST